MELNYKAWMCLIKRSSFVATTLTSSEAVADLLRIANATDANNFLRFNVAHSDDPQVRERFFRLLDTSQK